MDCRADTDNKRSRISSPVPRVDLLLEMGEMLLGAHALFFEAIEAALDRLGVAGGRIKIGVESIGRRPLFRRLLRSSLFFNFSCPHHPLFARQTGSVRIIFG